MRNKVEFHDKKWEKSQMLSQLSLSPPPFFFFLSVIVICIFLLSSIVYILILFFFFQDKVKCSFFLCKVVTSVSNRNVYEML